MKSMTGYGRARKSVDGKEISVEVRAVNHRYLDVNLKCPRAYGFLEEPLKKAASTRIARGKVDVFVQILGLGAEDLRVSVNTVLAQHYMDALRALSEATGLPNDVSLLSLAKMPEVLVEEQAEPDTETLTAGVLEIFDEALGEFDAMRTVEGEKMAEDVRMRGQTIVSLLEKVEERAPQRTIEYREKLEKRMQELLADTAIDPQRILTEAAVFADRTAIDEETVRLRSHLSQMEQMLKDEKPIGRKLDFLVQEMNRESNTIGSKANDAALSKIVVELKSEIEKIREQIQNIE
ncbi:MAG: YicC family protein [Butyricicoccus pullicaecorum]|nr:YicC family protein [Butyricicoccus pullicaecorum]